VKKSSTMRTTVGLDLSDKVSTFVVLDRGGKVSEEGKVRTTPGGLAQQFSGEPRRIALETGCHSRWASRQLEDMGHEVIVANPRQVHLISKSYRKSDREDALMLARLARLDPALLRPVHHRSEEAHLDLALLRSRDALVATRTALVNHVRGSVKSTGERLPACSAASFHSKVGPRIPAALKPALKPVLASISELTAQIRGLDKDISRLLKKYPVARALKEQVHGVGVLTALAFVLTLEDHRRFVKSREVGAYLGLTRKRRESGESEPDLHITKAGDPFLRRLLVQCAHYILGPFGQQSDLRRWGLALASRLGRKRAIIAVTRKLAVLLHRLWTTGEVYEPLRQSTAQAAA
jgi:transposase